MKKNVNFALRINQEMRDKIHKEAVKNDNSINETMVRMLSNALINSQKYFELQYAKVDAKFTFKYDIDNFIESKYRLTGINYTQKCFYVTNLITRESEILEFSAYFSKPIYLI